MLRVLTPRCPPRRSRGLPLRAGMSKGLAGKRQIRPLGGEQCLREGARAWGIGGGVPGKPLTSRGPGKCYNFKELAEMDIFLASSPYVNGGVGGSYLCLFAGLVSPNLHQTPMHLLVLCLPPSKCVTRAGTLWLLHLHNQNRAGTQQVLSKYLWSERNQERRREAHSCSAVTRGQRFPSHSLGGVCSQPYLLSRDRCTHAKENQRHRGPEVKSSL